MHELGLALPRYARACIHEALGGPNAERPSGEIWEDFAATFVTLHRGTSLQGCIGSLEPRRALAHDLRRNALAAAFEDPRGIALDAADVDALAIEVSVLSSHTPLEFTDESDVLTALRPGVDGVVLRWGVHRGTFLPQVWEHLPEPHVFLRELKRKAGLPADFWSHDVSLARYTVREHKEPPLTKPRRGLWS